MGQAGGADHQGQRDGQHIDHRLVIEGLGVGAETEIDQCPVELAEQRAGAVEQFTAQRQLRQGIAGRLDGDEHGRHRVGEDQHAVLGHLGIGDALHAAEHGVDEHDTHPYIKAGLDRHLEKAREHDADAAHLAGHVGERDEDQADHGDHDACQLRVVAVADELRHGELAELAQVGRQQQGQQHVAAGPAHQVHAAVVAEKADQPGHGDEGGRRHPVGRGGHAVGDRVDVLAGDVEIPGAAGARTEGNHDIEREAQADGDESEGLQAHG